MRITPSGTTAKDYDTMPYQSVSYSGSEPNRLAGLAQLFGLDAPDIHHARVLELGCASGGNIIPLAVNYPGASFSGIDLSEGQVASANRTISDLGLRNISIRYGDIATATFDEGPFDYIIAHGVYSWIPEQTQDALLALIGTHLSDTGVAYVSYNTYPGWNMRNTVRDICSFHAGTTGQPAERVARARWMLDKIGTQAGAQDSPYAHLMQREAASTKNTPDSYILGEFLADDNWPCYFHEFVERAGKHDLMFFSEADLAQSVPEGLPEDTAKLVRDIAGESGMALEQYMDFFTGRQFRRSLLVKTGQQERINRKLGVERLANLNLTSLLRKDEAASMGSTCVFTGPGVSLKTDAQGMIYLLQLMQEAGPGSFTLAELQAKLIARGMTATPDTISEIYKTIFKLVINGSVQLSQKPLHVGRATDAKPKASALARYEIGKGQPWVSSPLHRPVQIDPGLAAAVCLVDGTRTRDEIERDVQTALEAGRLSQSGKTIQPQTPQVAAQAAEELTAKILQLLETSGLLEPAGELA